MYFHRRVVEIRRKYRNKTRFLEKRLGGGFQVFTVFVLSVYFCSVALSIL